MSDDGRTVQPRRIPELIGGASAGQPVPEDAWHRPTGHQQLVAMKGLPFDAPLAKGQSYEVEEYHARLVRLAPGIIIKAYVHDQIAYSPDGVSAVAKWVVDKALGA